MEKISGGFKCKGIIDLNLPLEQNLRRIASKLGKSLSDLTVMVLAKPRHDAVIKQIHNLGAKVLAIPMAMWQVPYCVVYLMLKSIFFMELVVRQKAWLLQPFEH